MLDGCMLVVFPLLLMSRSTCSFALIIIITIFFNMHILKLCSQYVSLRLLFLYVIVIVFRNMNSGKHHHLQYYKYFWSTFCPIAHQLIFFLVKDIILYAMEFNFNPLKSQPNYFYNYSKMES